MLVTLLNDLLDLAKLETMNFQFNEEDFNLNRVIDQVYDTFIYQAAQKKITIVKDYKVDIQNVDSKYYNLELSTSER